MNKTKKVSELNAIFKAIDDARQSILKSFPYNRMTIVFSKKLKALLKEIFKDNIQFERDERFGYIQGTFKKIRFEINIWNGIILTIDDEKKANLFYYFKPIFNRITGVNPICSYDYCSRMQTPCPTIEWSLHPEERLYELINMIESETGCYKKNFKDFYTTSIINSFGDKLLTQEGYDALFKYKQNDIKFKFYKIDLIRALRPDIDNATLHNWINTCQAFNENQKQLLK